MEVNQVVDKKNHAIKHVDASFTGQKKFDCGNETINRYVRNSLKKMFWMAIVLPKYSLIMLRASCLGCVPLPDIHLKSRDWHPFFQVHCQMN